MNLKGILIGGSLFLLLVAIPLTVYVAQQQQQTQSQAQKSTNICFAETPATATTTTPACGPASISKKTGDSFSLDVIMDPGSNQVSTVRLNLVYDATKLATVGAGVVPAPNTVTPLTETVYGSGTATARFGIIIDPNVGVDPTKVLSQKTKIATVQFKVIDTATLGTTSIAFGQTLVLSSNPADGQDEDVLSSATPLSLTITAGATPNPTAAQTTNIAPSCTSLNIDRVASGSAPFSITFTANGRDTDGTISKVTFDYGDGPVEDVTQTGGIGTNTVSVQRAHTYNNAGTFAAKATLTDDKSTISSASATCAQSIAVSSTGGTATSSATPTSAIATATPIPTITVSPGPTETFIGIGALGVVVAVIGAVLSLAF